MKNKDVPPGQLKCILSVFKRPNSAPHEFLSANLLLQLLRPLYSACSCCHLVVAGYLSIICAVASSSLDEEQHTGFKDATSCEQILLIPNGTC